MPRCLSSTRFWLCWHPSSSADSFFSPLFNHLLNNLFSRICNPAVFFNRICSYIQPDCKSGCFRQPEVCSPLRGSAALHRRWCVARSQPRAASLSEENILPTECYAAYSCTATASHEGMLRRTGSLSPTTQPSSSGKATVSSAEASEKLQATSHAEASS